MVQSRLRWALTVVVVTASVSGNRNCEGVEAVESNDQNLWMALGEVT